MHRSRTPCRLLKQTNKGLILYSSWAPTLSASSRKASGLQHLAQLNCGGDSSAGLDSAWVSLISLRLHLGKGGPHKSLEPDSLIAFPLTAATWGRGPGTLYTTVYCKTRRTSTTNLAPCIYGRRCSLSLSAGNLITMHSESLMLTLTLYNNDINQN